MTAQSDPPAPTQQQFHQAITRGADGWYGACLRITRNTALAEDAVQDALLNAWAKRGQFQGTSTLETWIHRIAVNAALAIVRKQRAGVWTELHDVHAAQTASSEELYGDHRVECELGRELDRLSDLERVCFVLKHLEGWRIREIADRLDSGIGPVKQALFRGVQKLRGGMKTLGGEK